jgi:phospholipid/cholesterol/gamma-HCH transport system substrate-binding protein
MTPKRKLLINLVAVGLLAVGMVAWVFFSLVGLGTNKPYTVTADFAASGGVFINQEVTYRGVLVGQVGDMTLNDDGVEIELVIEPEWTDRIPADVLANVRSKSAVGEQFVNLTPQGESEETLQDGDVIDRARTSLPVDFQALLRSLDKVLVDVSPEQTARVIEELAGGLGGREEEIATILESLGTLSDAFASVADEQKTLLDNSTRAGTEFLRTKEEFAAAIAAADSVFEVAGRVWPFPTKGDRLTGRVH